MSEAVIEARGLAKSFGRRPVLRGVDLAVPRGSVFGFLGLNGAGKSTTIRILLGLLQPSAGVCRVAGVDPAKDGVEVRRRVGYMAENQQMYGWMTVGETIRWCSRFYTTWDAAFAESLRGQMKLAAAAKVGTLSKGQSSKLALLLALAHQPEVVVLDDPALGLDPLARRDFLRDVIGHLQGRGVTVFFSSHLLYEIEPICDRVAILHDGRVLVSETVETLRGRVKRVEMRLSEHAAPLAGAGANTSADASTSAGADKGVGAAAGIPGLLDVQRDGPHLAFIVEDIEVARPRLERASANGMALSDLTLDEIFEAYVAGRREIPA